MLESQDLRAEEYMQVTWSNTGQMKLGVSLILLLPAEEGTGAHLTYYRCLLNEKGQCLSSYPKVLLKCFHDLSYILLKISSTMINIIYTQPRYTLKYYTLYVTVLTHFSFIVYFWQYWRSNSGPCAC